ncbi:MAG: TonB-dependent receptor [Salinibacter sp.]
MLRIVAITTALVFFCVGGVLAQERVVEGTVTDASSGETLPGANVTVEGTSAGTTTNADGEYEVQVSGPDAVLVFSFVGYERQTIEVGEQEVIDVSLQPDVGELDEVVVVGYGSQEERDLTGTVSKVSAGDLNQSDAVSPDRLISGKVSGVQISASDGAPGSQSYIRIRGATSVNADSQPLFVIDGVPISNESNTAGRNPLNFLNPSDIQDVTVLKDASATAIYGSRGANGVILIETKQAEGDGASVSYQGSVSASTIADDIDVLGRDEFVRVVEERAPSQLSRLGDAETNWQDATQRTGYAQDHSLAIARNYEDADFRVSLGYLDQQGILETSNTERMTASVRYNQQLFNNQVNVRTNLRGAKTQDQFEPGMVGNAALFAPTQPIRDVDSEYGGFFEWDNGNAESNPVAQYVLQENIGENWRSLGDIEAEYEPSFVEGLSARLKFGYDVTTGERELFAPTNLKSQALSSNPGLIERANFTRTNTLLDAYLNYDRTLSPINSAVDVTAGYSYQDFYEEYPEFSAEGLSTDIFGPNSSDPASETNTFVTEIPSRLISGFLRANYTFMDRYLLTFTVRRDGSSRFGPKNRWGTFPSAALAWRAHEEPFLEDVDVLSNLKLRVSWGQTGNQEIGDFLYEPLWVPGGNRARVQFGDDFVSTIRPNAADETLKWESTTTTNVGIDYGVLDGRISGSFEYYVKDTDDLLFTVPVAGGANLSDRVLTNIGSMRNEGLEMSIDAQVVNTEDFSWNFQANASTNSNELLQLNRGADEDFQGISTGGISGGVGNTIQILREGEPINSFLTYRHRRDDNGDPVYEDVNDDGTIDEDDLYVDVNDDGTVNEEDRVVSGNPQPDWVIGHTSEFRYQNVDLSFTVRAHLGQQVYNNVASNYGHFDNLRNFAPSNVHESAVENGFETPQYFSDVYVEDASFLRLDNVSLGYTVRSLPSVNQLRVFARASNVFILSGYSGPDPEVGGPGSSNIGIDDQVYPRSRSFTAGINLQL